MKRRHVTWGTMAGALNQPANLRARIELVRRLSDGLRSPASLEMRVSVDRYRHEGHAFVPPLEVPKAPPLDMDPIQFLQAVEELLDAKVEVAALEASVDPSIGLRFTGG